MHSGNTCEVTKVSRRIRGFTLIELSIVLVIIGLVIGGVLAGQDMIQAAYVRAQIAQINQYNTAVHTFQSKYSGLPGDLSDPYATQFGFVSRGSFAGEGDGNGVIEGTNCQGAGCNTGYEEFQGETGTFWHDLSTAQLIENGFSTAGEVGSVGGAPMTVVQAYLPPAKIGGGNYVYVWSGGPSAGSGIKDNINYFGVSAWPYTFNGSSSFLYSQSGMTVQQAYNIDKKTDDGYPQSGNVLALYSMVRMII
jgi:prepilin-type N-terminal cleavage/methylation domain-containing protein